MNFIFSEFFNKVWNGEDTFLSCVEMVPYFFPQFYLFLNRIESLPNDLQEFVFGNVGVSIDSEHKEKTLWVKIIVFEVLANKPKSIISFIGYIIEKSVPYWRWKWISSPNPILPFWWISISLNRLVMFSAFTYDALDLAFAEVLIAFLNE